VGIRDSIPAPLRATFSGGNAVHEATEAARRFAASAGLHATEASHLAIVVEELVTNYYEHSGASAADTIDLELSGQAEELVLTLVDCGTPFDPRSLTLSNEVPDRGGGAGLKLVRSWASAIDYQQTGGLNRLTVRLPLS
jgi:anti-sigma regulatory factor (Ser/Thr protein kinase)